MSESIYNNPGMVRVQLEVIRRNLHESLFFSPIGATPWNCHLIIFSSSRYKRRGANSNTEITKAVKNWIYKAAILTALSRFCDACNGRMFCSKEPMSSDEGAVKPPEGLPLLVADDGWLGLGSVPD